jgi:hypothetical protein
MELENDLRNLRLSGAPIELRARVLRDARTAPRTSLLPPWLAALEQHWLYLGRAPAIVVVAAWLVIASLRFSTPASLLPESHVVSTLDEDQLAQLEYEDARSLAELEHDDLSPSPIPARQQPFPVWLPPRS